MAVQIMWFLFFAQPQLAHAHAGAELTAVDVETPDALETGFGLLLRGEDGWDWVCHEAVTATDSLLTPGYTQGPSGVWLATVPSMAQVRVPGESMYRSLDGCDWNPVQGATDFVVGTALFVDAEHAVAATAGLAEGDVNGLLASADGGLTWAMTERFDGTRLTIGMAAHANTVWAASFDPDAPTMAILHKSENAGQTWTNHPMDVDAWVTEGALAVEVLAANDGGAWVGVGYLEGHVLLRSNADGTELTQVLQVGGSLIDGVVDDDGGVWILEGARDLLYSADGSSFAAVSGAPPAIGIGASGGDALLASSAIFTGALSFSVSPGGEVTRRVVAADVKAPKSCPADSHMAQICEPLWDSVNLPIPADTDDSDSTDDTDSDEPGCGCTSSPQAGVLWLLLLPLVTRRRR